MRRMPDESFRRRRNRAKHPLRVFRAPLALRVLVRADNVSPRPPVHRLRVNPNVLVADLQAEVDRVLPGFRLEVIVHEMDAIPRAIAGAVVDPQTKADPHGVVEQRWIGEGLSRLKYIPASGAEAGARPVHIRLLASVDDARAG